MNKRGVGKVNWREFARNKQPYHSGVTLRTTLLGLSTEFVKPVVSGLSPEQKLALIQGRDHRTYFVPRDPPQFPREKNLEPIAELYGSRNKSLRIKQVRENGGTRGWGPSPRLLSASSGALLNNGRTDELARGSSAEPPTGVGLAGKSAQRGSSRGAGRKAGEWRRPEGWRRGVTRGRTGVSEPPGDKRFQIKWRGRGAPPFSRVSQSERTSHRPS